MTSRRAYELMTTEVITVPEKATLSDAIRELAENNISSLIVTNSHTPVGIITERDIAKIVATRSEFNDLPVSDFMSKNPVAVYKNADVVTALEIMERNHIRRVVVTDKNGELRGILTYSDILRKMDEEFFKIHATIESIMTEELLKVNPDDTLITTIGRMTVEKKSCILVVSDERPVGIFTERDIVKLLLKNTPMDMPVKDICTLNIIYVTHTTLLYDALKIMAERRIRHLVVVDDKLKLKGIVTQTNIINLLQENIARVIKDQLQSFKESLDVLETGFIEFELNPEGTILWLNNHGSKELGFSSLDDAIGSSFSDLLKDKSQWLDFISRPGGKTGVNPFIFNLGAKVIDGSFGMGKFSAKGIFKDITNRYTENEFIRGERNRFEYILKTLSEGILIFDRNGTAKDVNEAVLKMFDLTRDEVLGRSYHKFPVVDESGNVLDKENMLMSSALRKGAAVKNTIRGFKKLDGTIVWFNLSITPILNQGDEVEEVVSVLTDITELYTLEKRNQKILETAREGYWEVRLDGTITKINKALSSLLGYGTDDLIGKSIYDIVDGDNKKIFEKALEKRRQGISESYEITLGHKNGSAVYAIISASPQVDISGKVEGAFAFITDVTDLRSAHNMLHIIASFSKEITRALTETEAYEILRHYLLSLRKGSAKIDAAYLLTIDPSRHFTEEVINYNEAGLQDTGKFPGLDKCKAYIYAGTFLVNDLSGDYACPHHRLDATAGSYCCSAVNIGGAVAGILHIYSKSPNFFSGSIRETIDSFIALLVPVINNMRLLEMNKKLALIDPLTGLYNRRYLEAFMEKQLAIIERNNQVLSIIMLDIDDFKYFNDTNGHEAGDIAMKALAFAVTDNIRMADIGVRYGGEEFIIMLPNTDKTTALEVAERIRIAIATNPVNISSDKKAYITASFGVATYNTDANSLDDLIGKADAALYAAKKAGKNKTCLA